VFTLKVKVEFWVLGSGFWGHTNRGWFSPRYRRATCVSFV